MIHPFSPLRHIHFWSKAAFNNDGGNDGGDTYQGPTLDGGPGGYTQDTSDWSTDDSGYITDTGGGDSQGTSSGPGVYQGPNIDFSPGYTIDTNGRVVSSAGNVIADAGRQALPQNYSGGYVSFVDRFDGGGPGASGNTFGGLLGPVTNMFDFMGVAPLGYGSRSAAPSAMTQSDGGGNQFTQNAAQNQGFLDQQAYQAYVAKGGALSFEDWLAAGKPSLPTIAETIDQTDIPPMLGNEDPYVAPVYTQQDIIADPTYTTQSNDDLSGIASLTRSRVYDAQ